MLGPSRRVNDSSNIRSIIVGSAYSLRRGCKGVLVPLKYERSVRSIIWGYAFHADTFSNPMILCFDGTTGSVSGDDTQFTMFGTSPLAGWAQNKGAELFEVYQVDRTTGKVLFTKTRIGSKSLLPGLPDIIGSFVGDAVKMKYVPAGN